MRVRPLLAVAFVAFAASITACATPEQRPSATMPSAPSFSTPSTSFQTSYVSRGSHVQRVQVDADLVVRPDRVCVPVQLHATANDAATAMRLVEEAAAGLKSASGQGANVRVDDIDARSAREGTGEQARVVSSVVMKGVVEIELADEDAWARAKRVAALHRAVIERATPDTLPPDHKEGDPTLHVAVGNPEPGVRDVEQHRAKLLASWSERAKAVASAATVDGATLELLGCVPPAQVQVVGGTLEKVGLSLHVSCTFQVRKTP
jgi:hypothetical protein